MFVLYSFQATVQLADILHVCLVLFQATVQLADILHVWFVLISGYSSVGRHSTCLSCTHFRLQFSWRTFYMFCLYSFQTTVQLVDILHVCLSLISDYSSVGGHSTCLVCTYYTPRKLCLWEGILFSRCPSERPTDRPNLCP